MGGEGDYGGSEVVVVGRAEIDTRAPFRSVKEAVALFGDKVLAGELHAGRRLTVSESRAATPRLDHHAAAPAAVVTAAHHHVVSAPRQVAPPPPTAELAEAKQELEKERDEKQKLAGCIQSLQQELGHAMRELKRLKACDDQEAAAAKVIDLQVDEGGLTFVHEADDKWRASTDGGAASGGDGEFQKKRYVTFADPPTAAAAAACRAPPVADVVMELHPRAPQQPPQAQPQYYYREPRFTRQMSAGHESTAARVAAAAGAGEEGRKKKKKKPLIPLVGALFMRKKSSSSASHGVDSS